MVATQSNPSLIVDFPVCRTARSEAISARSMSVRFSPQNQGRYIEYPSLKENQAKWNSGEDYAYFQQVMLKDVVRCSAMLVVAAKESQDTSRSEKHIIRCVGLDNLISHNVKARYCAVKEARKAHAQIVLSAQQWQRKHNVQSAAYLARVSQASSQPARERSFKVAVLSASVL